MATLNGLVNILTDIVNADTDIYLFLQNNKNILYYFLKPALI